MLCPHGASLLPCALAIVSGISAWAQDNEFEPPGRFEPASRPNAVDDAEAPGSSAATSEITDDPGGQLASRPGPLPADAFRTDEAGVRYRDLFRDRQAPFRTSGQAELDSPLTGSYTSDIGYDGSVTGFRNDVRIREPMPFEGTQSVRTSFDIMGARLGYSISGTHGFNLLGHGFEPQDADLKVGPLFFKLRALSGAVLFTDNANRTEENRESGAISIVRLAGSVVAQLTESLRLSASGNLIWLPFEGKVGVTTSSGAWDFNLAGRSETVPVAQIDWEGRIGGWDVYVSDSFYAYLGGELGDDYLFRENIFEGSSFDEYDTIGRYRFGGYGTREYRDVPLTERNRDEDFDVASYTNSLDIGAERLFPGPVRLRLRAYRDDYWYNQGTRGGPSLREGASALLRVERPNLRFKPYARYEISHTDVEPEWDQLIVGGISGPITDQLFVNMYAGHFLDGTSGDDRVVAGIRLDHVAGPYTYHSLFAGREIDDTFGRSEVVDRVTYRIHQVLGPKIFADAFTSYEVTSTLDNSEDERTEFYAGIRLSILPGPRTQVRASYLYNRIRASSPGFVFSGDDRLDDADDFDSDSLYVERTFRLEIGYSFTDTLRGSFLYAHRNVDANVRRESYYENLVILTLTKYFY